MSRRDRRILSHLAAVAAVAVLALSAGITALAVRSIWTRDELYLNLGGHICIVGSFPRHVHVIVCKDRDDRGRPPQLLLGREQYPAHPLYWQVRYADNGQEWRLAVPYWLLLTASLPLPAWWLALRWRQRRRRQRGLCQVCGYDLRASPDRCPECGTPPTTERR